MTRKDYIALADALKHSRPPALMFSESDSQWRYDVRVIAAVLKEDNPRFKPETFYARAGLSAE